MELAIKLQLEIAKLDIIVLEVVHLQHQLQLEQQENIDQQDHH